MKFVHSLNKVLIIVLLAVPFCNWIVEIFMRWTEFVQKKGTVRLVVAILATAFFGTIFGWIDLVFFLLTDKFALED